MEAALRRRLDDSLLVFESISNDANAFAAALVTVSQKDSQCARSHRNAGSVLDAPGF
jgi:hypothetical protein